MYTDTWYAFLRLNFENLFLSELLLKNKIRTASLNLILLVLIRKLKGDRLRCFQIVKSFASFVLVPYPHCVEELSIKKPYVSNKNSPIRGYHNETLLYKKKLYAESIKKKLIKICKFIVYKILFCMISVFYKKSCELRGERLLSICLLLHSNIFSSFFLFLTNLTLTKICVKSPA